MTEENRKELEAFDAESRRMEAEDPDGWTHWIANMVDCSQLTHVCSKCGSEMISITNPDYDNRPLNERISMSPHFCVACNQAYRTKPKMAEAEHEPETAEPEVHPDFNF